MSSRLINYNLPASALLFDGIKTPGVSRAEI